MLLECADPERSAPGRDDAEATPSELRANMDASATLTANFVPDFFMTNSLADREDQK
jgi:hypothetical protein